MRTKFNGILTLILAFVVQASFAQMTITGTVTDDMGGSIPGASVLVKGTQNGTITDFDGKYSISANTGDILMFSFAGNSTEKTVGTSSTVNTMIGAEAITEVVVTGFGVKREKKSLGYSQQSVKGTQLQKAKDTDINNALAGKVSGVQIVGNSSTTFGNSQIKLRGETGVLYVIDGVYANSISDINTDNIADMSVLKGASATALYGPEGRNGVVIITTKTATPGETIFTVDQSISIGQVSALPDYQNLYGGGYSQTFNVFHYNSATDPASWASFEGDLYTDYNADESWGPKLEGQMVRHWDSWVQNTPEFGEKRAWSPTANDVKDFYNTAITSNISIGFSKGGENYKVRTSIASIDQDGIVPNSNQKTIKFATNLSFDLNKQFSVFTNINYQHKNTLNNPDQNYGNLGSNMNQWWQRQLDLERLSRYERNGQIVSWNIRGPRDARPLYWDMPAFHSYENIRNDFEDGINGKIGSTYKFNDNISITAEVRNTYNAYSGNDRATTKSLLDQSEYREYKYSKNKNQLFGIINYDDKFLNNKLDLNTSIGGDIFNNKYKYLKSSTQGGLTIPKFYNLGGSKDPVSTSTYYENSKTRGTFIKASLGYANTVYLDGSYRLDWSSTADPANNRVATYGSSVSVLLNKFIPKNNIISFAKIRTGLSVAPYFPDPYQISTTYTVGSSLYQGNGTLGVSGTQNNPLLKGGLRKEFEIGGEFKMYKNKIDLDLTYFERTDDELPTSVDLDGSTGYRNITVNSGKTISKGIEIGLNTSIIKNENFSWNIGFNYGTLQKTVEEIYEGVTSYNISTYTSNMKLQARVGEEYGLFYGTGFARHTDDSYIFTDSDKFARHKNKLIGSLLPDYTYGFTTNLEYKNVSLFLGFDGQKGGLFYSRTERYMNHSGLSQETAELNDRGVPKRDPIANGGGVHIVGVLQTGYNTEGVPISDGTVVDKYIDAQDYYYLGNLGNIYANNVHDASYLKLRTIRLNYTLNKELISKTGLEDIQIGVYGNNVWLIASDLPWVDPSELEKRNDVNWAENGTLPMTSSYGINLKLTF